MWIFLNIDAIALIGYPGGGGKSLLHLFSVATVSFRACKRKSGLCAD